MPCSRSFVDHAVDLLSSVGPVDARRMFGGYGVYGRGVMFALLDDDELFFKTDEQSRDRFRSAGCRMWSYGGVAETGYYRPPDEAHEDPESMEPWARLGLEAALRQKAVREAKAAASAARRATRRKEVSAGGRRAVRAPPAPAKVRAPARSHRRSRSR